LAKAEDTKTVTKKNLYKESAEANGAREWSDAERPLHRVLARIRAMGAKR